MHDTKKNNNKKKNVAEYLMSRVRDAARLKIEMET